MMASAFCSQPCGASSGLADLRLHEGKSTNKSWGRTEYLLPLPDSTLGGSIVLWIRPCGYGQSLWFYCRALFIRPEHILGGCWISHASLLLSWLHLLNRLVWEGQVRVWILGLWMKFEGKKKRDLWLLFPNPQIQNSSSLNWFGVMSLSSLMPRIIQKNWEGRYR